MLLPADNAPSSPHQSDGPIVQLPVVYLSGLPQQHEPLGVRNNLGGIQSLGRSNRRKRKHNMTSSKQLGTIFFFF